MKVYLDGQFVHVSDARVSAFDAAVQHGVGLFETMQAFGGKVFRLQDHLDRLIESAKETGLTDRLRPAPLAEAVELALQHNKATEARVRLTVTGGDLSLLAAARTGKKIEHHPTLLISVTEPTAYPPAMFTEGVLAVIADAKANPLDPLAGHKTINYWQRLRTLTHAAAAKAGEALWFTVTNHLCGGSVSNAFLVKDRQLFTPIARGEETAGALPSPVLPGITRKVVLEVAEALSVPVQKKMLTINDVLEADEVLLTNSGWGVMPVVTVEKKTIGTGKPGEITQQLRMELSRRIETECGIAPGSTMGVGTNEGTPGAASSGAAPHDKPSA